MAAVDIAGSVKIIDTKTSKVLFRVRARPHGSHAVIANDGKQVTIQGKDDELHVWDIVKKEKLRELKCEGRIKAFLSSENGALAVVALAGGFVEAWDSSTGKLKWRTRLNTSVTALALSPDNETLTGGDSNGPVYALSANSGKLLRKSAENGFCILKISRCNFS